MEINVTSSIVDNHAMPMCSIAASGSTAESHRRNTGVLLVGRTRWSRTRARWSTSASDGISGVCFVAGRVRVERAFVRICGVCFVARRGVCSVARHVKVERFLEVLPWFKGLFPIESIALNAATKDVNEPKELASTNHAVCVSGARAKRI